MSMNVLEAKEKIMNFISERGPSLPVHLTKVTEMSLTFTSALLSELLAERKLKLSNLRVGTSPLYFIPGQEEKLESFISNLKEPEIDAFKKLKENKILDDERQTPVTRVALRSIRDFAIPIKNHDKLYWKYHLLPDENAIEAISVKGEPVQAIGQERVIGQQIWEDIKKQQFSKENIEELVRKKVEDIANKIVEERKGSPIKEHSNVPAEEIKQESSETSKEIVETIPEKLEVPSKETPKAPKKVSKKPKKISQKEALLNRAKEFLIHRGFTNLTVLKSDSTKSILQGANSGERLVIFTSKKRLDEPELLRDLKKYNPIGLPVEVFMGGEPSKKLTETIYLLERVKKISKIGEQ